MRKAFVIAEAASTHDGDLNKALGLVAIAANAGADACKFQFWSSADRLADRRRVGPEYREIYRRYQVPQGWLAFLAGECARLGIEFMCTAFLPEDIAVIGPFVRRFKIASFEASDPEFLLAHNRFDKPVILSTGMMNWGDVRTAINSLPHCQAALHCVSAYPCKEPNLAAIGHMREALGRDVDVGLSDHTGNALTGALAVAAGASVIEAHYQSAFTDPANPDCAPAVPDLAQYIANIRLAERFMGDGSKYCTAAEAAMAKYRVGHNP